MSYILEALRRADAERARGAVPGLNTPAPEMVDDETATAPRPWLWLAVGLMAALAVVVAWRWTMAPDAAQAPVVSTASIPVTPAPLVTTPVAEPPDARPSSAPSMAASEATAAVPSTAPAATAGTAAPSTPSTSTSTSPPARVEPPAAQPSRRAAIVKESPPRKAAPVVAAASPVVRAEPARRIYRQAELPDEIRRALPRLTIGGSIYSESAASRMIVINGQVLHEGEKLGPDLELHQIRMKEAVLDFRGYRYEVPY